MIAPYLPMGCLCVAMGVMEFVWSWCSVGCVKDPPPTYCQLGEGLLVEYFYSVLFFCI